MCIDDRSAGLASSSAPVSQPDLSVLPPPSRTRFGGAWAGCALLAFLGLLVSGTCLVADLLRTQKQLQNHVATTESASVLAQYVDSEVTQRLRDLPRIRTAWTIGRLRSISALRPVGEAILREPRDRNIYLQVNGLDWAGNCRWAIPSGDSPARDAGYFRGSPWKAALARAAAQESESVLIWPNESAAPPTAALIIPLPATQPENPRSAAFLVVRMALTPILEEALRGNSSVGLELLSGSQLVARAGALPLPAAYSHERSIQVADQQWRLRMAMAADVEGGGLLHAWVLWIGLPLSGFIVLALSIIHLSWLRQDRHKQRYLWAVESLSKVSAAACARLDAGQDVLEDLVESARRLLEMDRSSILVFTDGSQHILKAIAVVGDMPPDRPSLLPLDGLPACAQCLETGQLRLFDDMRLEVDGFELEQVKRYNAAAAAIIPLHIEQRCIGMLLLSGAKPRRFSDADWHLARLLGAHTAIVLANNQLYQHMRNALQTQKVLLRELHHRVKNNLSGIVALLSMNAPGLSTEARQWLDGMIERIRAMARTHELFVAGAPDVALERLLEQVVSSLGAIRPARLVIESRVSAPEIRLSTSQAVALAIVLHELGMNAIRHGLSDGGTLQLCGSAAGGKLHIEVIDDGSAVGVSSRTGEVGINPHREALAVAPCAHGIGLTLVRELVGRELHGEFALQTTAGEGTVAVVEFPLASGGVEGVDQ